MIGRINTFPGLSKNRINHNNDTHPKKILKNNNTGAVINVKNLNYDFRIIIKERSLYKDVKNNHNLANIADIESHDSLNARLSSLGRAVTAIYNVVENGKAKERSVDICDKNPENKSIKLDLDPFLTNRGAGYIKQFIGHKTPLDSTNYATGLRVGLNEKDNKSDFNTIHQFNSTWELLIDMTTKK